MVSNRPIDRIYLPNTLASFEREGRVVGGCIALPGGGRLSSYLFMDILELLRIPRLRFVMKGFWIA